MQDAEESIISNEYAVARADMWQNGYREKHSTVHDMSQDAYEGEMAAKNVDVV